MVDRVFGGSAELLLTHLVADRDLSPDELKRLRSFMDEQIEKRRKP
jgi:predicted transcriptional regulator